MKKTTTTTETTLGDVSRETTKERQPSKMYAMRQFKAAIEKVKELKLVNAEDAKELNRMNEEMVKRYISMGLEL